MATKDSPPPLRTKGFLWGPWRVRLGIPLGELSRRVGINKGTLSHLESGRMVATAAEYERVHAVLRDAEAALSKGSTAGG